MRSLTMNEIGFVAGGPSDPPPTCPGGMTLTGVTYTNTGAVSTYTCTPNGMLPQDTSTLDTLDTFFGAAAAIVAFVGLLIILDS